MLGPHQDTFWHLGLKGGNCKQRVSQGMVEDGWYLPGEHRNDKFPYPVTFANVRQSGRHSEVVCKTLHDSSSVICIFVEDISGELNALLEAKQSLEKVIIVVLHKREEVGNIKRRRLEFLKRFSLEDTRSSER